jgi:stress-induced morphogen
MFQATDLIAHPPAAALKPVKLEIIPAYGDPNGSHITILVVSDAFEGKRALQRQQMVYKVSSARHARPTSSLLIHCARIPRSPHLRPRNCRPRPRRPGGAGAAGRRASEPP